MRKRIEGCSVALGTTKVSGPTPVNAIHLASQLAEQLFGELDVPPPSPMIRFSFWTPRMLWFSFQLAVPVIARLAQMGARLECCVNCDEPNWAGFAPHEVGASVVALTADRYPHEITARLGVEPTSVQVAGERRSPHTERVYERGRWAYELRDALPGQLSRLVRDLRTHLPPSAGSLWGDDEVVIFLAVQGLHMIGGFHLDDDAVADIAALNAPLYCFFWAEEG